MELSERFLDLAEACSLEVSSYSGRGMFGKTCCAISRTLDGEPVNLTKVIIDMMSNLMASLEEVYVNLIESSAYDPHASGKIEEIWDLAKKMPNVRSDQLGLGHVIYWPDIEFPDTLEEVD